MKKLLLALLLVSPCFATGFADGFNQGFNQGSRAMQPLADRIRENRERNFQQQQLNQQLNQQKAMMALEQVNNEISQEPENADLYVQRGSIWKYQLQDWAQASSDFVKATKLDKYNAKAWKELCFMYFQTQMHKEAESSCLNAFAIDSTCTKCLDYEVLSSKKNKLKTGNKK